MSSPSIPKKPSKPKINLKDFGVIELVNGEQYKGELDKDGLPSGYGAMQGCIDGELFSYEGYFSKGEFEGYGRLQFGDVLYSGEFYNGLKNGIGKEKYLSGDIESFQGHWCNGKKSGNGSCVYRDGSSLMGSWYEDEIDGICYRTKNDDLKDLPEAWIKGSLVGYLIDYPNGNAYIGKLDNNGKRSGRGEMIFNDETRLWGEWRDDKIVDIVSVTKFDETFSKSVMAVDSGVDSDDWSEMSDFVSGKIDVSFDSNGEPSSFIMKGPFSLLRKGEKYKEVMFDDQGNLLGNTLKVRSQDPDEALEIRLVGAESLSRNNLPSRRVRT